MRCVGMILAVAAATAASGVSATVWRRQDASCRIGMQPPLAHAPRVTLGPDRYRSQTYDFTHFEDVVLPKWLERFQVGPEPGNFSFLPMDAKDHAPTVYGAADVAHVLAGTNQFNLTATESAAWAGHVNSFQDAATGFYNIENYESVGFQPWHAAAYAASAVRLAGGKGPAFPFKFATEIAGNESSWAPTFEPLLDPHGGPGMPHDFWSAGHKIAGVPAVLTMFNQTAQPELEPFLRWYWAWLGGAANRTVGFWCEDAPSVEVCLGGSFHIYFYFTWMRRGWPYPATVLDTALGMQGKDGLWGGGSPNYIDLDGLYSVTRSSVLAGRARWSDVESACDRLVAAAAKALNDDNEVLRSGVYAKNTHTLPAPIVAVAECAKHFPAMVRTRRPWVVTLDIAPFV